MPVFLLAAVLWRATGPLTIPPGEVRRVSLPAVTGPAHLGLRVRLEYWRPAGSTYALRATVDGTPLGPMRGRRTPRLVGPRPVVDGLAPFRAGVWRVPFAPATGGAGLVLDVSDLLRAEQPNELVLEHTGAAGPGAALVVSDLRLERGPVGAEHPVAPPPDWSRPRLGRPTPPRFEAHADETTVHVTFAGETAVLRTTVRGGAREWRRTLVVHPTHVEVRDTVANPGPDTIGLRVRHALATDAEWIHLAGSPDPSVTQTYAPWNPTIFVPIGRYGLGLVAEDDVFRLQLTADFDAADGTAGLRTDLFCLGPGERHTFAWSIYPTRTGSYFDFRSTLRADWGVDKTIPGSYVWFKPDDILALPTDRLGERLAHQGVAVAAHAGGWVDRRRPEEPPRIGFGTDVLSDAFADYRERLREAIERLHAARPGIRALVYFDAQRDSSPDARVRYADSLLLVPGRGPRSTDFDGRFTPSWEMVPTGQNRYGQALTETLASLGTLGADGLYWDEMDAVDYEGPRLTEGTWDGRTCTLDPDGTVRERLGLTNVLTEEVKLAWAARRFILGNTPPTTRRFQARPDLRMVEAQHGPGWGAYGHLTDPLGYIGTRPDWDAVVALVEEGLLPAHTRLDYAYDVAARLFPLTPEYLQPGTLRGRERIVTVRSGTHGWVHAAGELRMLRYDVQGHEHPAHWRTKRRAGGIFVRVHLAPGEMAVIERPGAS